MISISADKPSTSPTSAAVRPASFIKVVLGETTDAPEGALRVTPVRTEPEELSIVVSSVKATMETEACELDSV